MIQCAHCGNYNVRRMIYPRVHCEECGCVTFITTGTHFFPDGESHAQLVTGDPDEGCRVMAQPHESKLGWGYMSVREEGWRE